MNDPFGGQIHWRTLAALKSNKRWAEHLMSGIIGVARLTIQEGKGALMGIVSITGEILGDLDSELRAGMEGGPFSFYAPLLSLSE